MTELALIQRFESNIGVRIYQIPMVVFPNGFVAYSYVLFGAGVPTLVDAGSGFDSSNDDLLAGLLVIQEQEPGFKISDIQRIIVTHGHVDHFGGVGFVLQHIGNASVGIHRLDRRVLTKYEERVVVATKDLSIYLERAGMRPEIRESMIDVYGFAKQHVSSIPVDFDLEEDHTIDGMEFIHAPGHCPGQVCIKLGDVMLVADHVLSQTTPHQAPESITHYTGLGHYEHSLQKIKQVDGIRLGLGGHEEPIHDLYGRIDDILKSHKRKLERVHDIVRNADRPLTISDISRIMYPHVKNYEILLAVEEAGAHIEYLYQRGYLSVVNLEQLETEDNPALLYEAS